VRLRSVAMRAVIAVMRFCILLHDAMVGSCGVAVVTCDVTPCDALLRHDMTMYITPWQPLVSGAVPRQRPSRERRAPNVGMDSGHGPSDSLEDK